MCCGGSMILWKIWHPTYGYIFDEEKLIKQDKYGVKKGVEKNKLNTQIQFFKYKKASIMVQKSVKTI
jgi:hypothetical protein